MTGISWPITVARARLFLSSYAALALMFAARFMAQDRWQIAVGFAVVGVFGAVDGWRLVRGTARRSTRSATVSAIAGQGAAVSGYLATYLLPFLGNLPSNWGDWVAYGLYFLIALIVYVKSDLAVVNPTLYALGYHVAHAKVGERSALIISRKNLSEGDRVNISEAVDVVFVHDVWEARSP